MSNSLDSRHFPCASPEEERRLARDLDAILSHDFTGNILAMLGGYRRILADNCRREEWEGVFGKLQTLFMCGTSVPLDGPMIGVTMAIRDSDYFRQTAQLFGQDRSAIANIEWMATCWNVTFGPTGLWMGKTFEPVSRQTFAARCDNDARTMTAFDPTVARIGRNFFREPAAPNFLQALGLPVLTEAWHLKDRPTRPGAADFAGEVLAANLEKEKNIPYSKTGGIFLAASGTSVVEEMRRKPVYQLNYRWPALEPAYPMTRLIDELVQIADGVYLGQLVMATRHYSLGALKLPLPGLPPKAWEVGEPYHPDQPSWARRLAGLFGLSSSPAGTDYGYQNNGFFLMIEPALAKQAYADDAFPHLRPRVGESGYRELGYDRSPTEPAAGVRAPAPESAAPKEAISDWVTGWQEDEALRRKFTTFCLESSPKEGDGDVRELLRPGESILQMLQRVQGEISAATSQDDSLRHFEKLNRLFRRGIAPQVRDGRFQGVGDGNACFDAPEKRLWYGAEDPCNGFDYYHGATLNLHFGFGDTLRQMSEMALLPGALAGRLEQEAGPNLLNAVWASIGRFIFPWAGKSFERISGRKLSMLLDESADLEARYPERVAQLKAHAASWPHYQLVAKNRQGFWPHEGVYAPHLRGGSWDHGMSEADQQFWRQEAAEHWVFGNNLQDERILSADALFKALDMNYRPPLPSIQQLADRGPSPFVRQGYIFLGVAGRESILPMNNGEARKKRVFQFHYRYPLIGGPFPIGLCLDELVEIADGLFLGQLIYATALTEPYHSSVDAARYEYQLFGYFLLLDNTWERHRRAIGFDVNVP